ncbi:MAG: hypothetical protein G8345_11410 [Magnetococcales bacterium]|nr:hypothetical protein [Magnetococcales bacterium]NGZ27481.1 hypothetical protein [Magnetococcales bacterium]
MKAVNVLAGLAMVVLLAGCGTKVPPAVDPILNVYDNYNRPIPGVYVLIQDPDLKRLNREVKTSSMACSSQNNLDVGTPLSHSLSRTMDNVFATLLHQEVPPTTEELSRLNATGVIRLKLQDFQTKLEFSSMLIKEKATATVSITLGASVTDSKGNSRDYSGGGSRVVTGEDGGSTCEIGALAMTSAIQQTMRDALERLAGQLANAPELRPGPVVK